ncbi:vacuolar protein sorting-associated protein 33B [Episyrphus balteatus]|uniref:vacuolar protein sorting-associated protein 33B n=1 Tax=Episyrphus balteatus TaxID=286459 RepID=UPI0024850FC4|nr:vacuolar protein sorting-associated protein 33B [Episyrphus balteatus]
MDNTINKKLQGFQLIAQEKLQSILCSIPNKKDLILDTSLIKPLEHICAASWLKLKGIQRIYKLDPENTIARQDNIQVFMIPNTLSTYRKVLNQIHAHESAKPSDKNSGFKSFHIICVPNCYMCFQTLLEEEGLYGIVQLHRFNWDLIYLDNGVLSMEVPQVFKSVFIHHDTSILSSIAQTLRIFFMICGKPDIVLSYGKHSAEILHMIDSLGPWPSSVSRSGHSDFSSMIIIDRDKDYPSSLLTPAIYSGLLLEVLKYRAGEVEIQPKSNKISVQKLKIFEISHDQQQPPQDSGKEKIPCVRLCSANDEIYAENRYKHFSQASSMIKAQAKAIGVEVLNLNKMKLDEMHDYVAKKLPKVTELKTKVLRHLQASEKVIAEMGASFQQVQSLEEDILNNTNRKKLLTEIDEALTTNGQKYNSIRLMCLAHLSMGFSSEELATFIRNYCNYFGYRYIHVFHYLARSGLLPPLEEEKIGKSKLLSNLPLGKFQQTEFQANANRLRLLVSTAGAESNYPRDSGGGVNCPSYVFNGLYIPLIAQLASFLVKATGIDDLAQKLGMVEKMELHLASLPGVSNIKQVQSMIKKNEGNSVFPMKTKTVFIFVVGGVTYAEIGACELIGQLTGSKIVVASNHIICGSDVIASAF